jgi:hypothetical protein
VLLIAVVIITANKGTGILRQVLGPFMVVVQEQEVLAAAQIQVSMVLEDLGFNLRAGTTFMLEQAQEGLTAVTGHPLEAAVLLEITVMEKASVLLVEQWS